MPDPRGTSAALVDELARLVLPRFLNELDRRRSRYEDALEAVHSSDAEVWQQLEELDGRSAAPDPKAWVVGFLARARGCDVLRGRHEPNAWRSLVELLEPHLAERGVALSPASAELPTVSARVPRDALILLSLVFWWVGRGRERGEALGWSLSRGDLQARLDVHGKLPPAFERPDVAQLSLLERSSGLRLEFPAAWLAAAAPSA